MRVSRLLLVGLVLAAIPARAALTSPVDGLEAALNEAWAHQPECREWLVDDLVVRQRVLTLTTSLGSKLLLGHEGTEPPDCSTRGWRVAQGGSRPRTDFRPCSQTLCDLLDRQPGLAPKLDAAVERSHRVEEYVLDPYRWSPPELDSRGAVWFASCAVTLLLLGLLVILRWRQKVPAVAPPLVALDWAALGALAVAGMGVRFWLARHRLLCNDEMISWGFDSLWRDFDGREIPMNPPLYRVVAWPLAAFTNGSPRIARDLPVLLGGALVVVVGRAGYLLGGRWMGLAAAVLAACHPGLVLATMYHRSYSLLVVMTALTVLSTVVALRSGRAVDRFLVAGCAAATILSHYFGACVFLGIAIWVLASDRSRWRAWIWPAATAVAIAAPFVPAVLLGAQAKAGSSLSSVGAEHARRLALSAVTVIGGVFQPSLEDVIFNGLSNTALWTGCLIVVVAFVLGVSRLPKGTRIGLVAIAVAAYVIPVVLSNRITGIREFLVVEAAVPVVLIFGALLAPGAAWLRIGAACLVAVFAVHSVQALYEMENFAGPTTEERAADLIRADSADWPIFVWRGPGYDRVAQAVGLSRIDADLTTGGHDPRLRSLRSCSTAAIREAAATVEGPVHVMIVQKPCEAADLSGRGVACAPMVEQGPDIRTTTCRLQAEGAAASPVAAVAVAPAPPSAVAPPPAAVAPAAPTPATAVPAPPPEPPHRPPPPRTPIDGDRVIGPGHEGVFMAAAAPFHLGTTGADGITLTRITIGASEAEYELRGTEGPPAILHASPHLSLTRIDGSDVTLETSESALSPPVRAAMATLRDSLHKNLTTEAWNEMLTVGTMPGGGSSTPGFSKWWFLFGVEVVALVGWAIWRRRKGARPPAQG